MLFTVYQKSWLLITVAPQTGNYVTLKRANQGAAKCAAVATCLSPMCVGENPSYMPSFGSGAANKGLHFFLVSDIGSLLETHYFIRHLILVFSRSKL